MATIWFFYACMCMCIVKPSFFYLIKKIQGWWMVKIWMVMHFASMILSNYGPLWPSLQINLTNTHWAPFLYHLLWNHSSCTTIAIPFSLACFKCHSSLQVMHLPLHCEKIMTPLFCGNNNYKNNKFYSWNKYKFQFGFHGCIFM